jgi:hypothetical protein
MRSRGQTWVDCCLGPGGLAGDGGWDGQWEVGCVQDLHVAYARDWGGAESCGRLRICNPANHHRPLSGQSTRQAAPKRNMKDTDIHRNNGAGKCDRCAYAPTMFPRKGRTGGVSTLVRRFRFLRRRRIMLDPHPARSRVACHQICFTISSSKRTSTKLHDNALATNGRASTHKYQHQV